MFVAYAYMNVLASSGPALMPSTVSLNDVISQTTHTTTCQCAADTREFPTSAGEFRSIRQHSVDSSLFIESPMTSQFPESVDSMLAGEQRSVDWSLTVVPQRHTCQSDDLDHDVFTDASSLPPPLPPKTSVVCSHLSVCLSVCLSTVREVRFIHTSRSSDTKTVFESG